MFARGPYRPRNFSALFAEAERTGISAHVSVRYLGTAQDVPLPPLRTGPEMAAQFPIVQHPPNAHWEDRAFRSVRPRIFEFRDVLVHSDAGIIVAGDVVVEDTLGQTSEFEHHYSRDAAGVTLHSGTDIVRLQGSYLSLLNFNHVNYYHWTMDTLGRLAAADNAALESCTEVLVPAFTMPFHADSFALTGLPATHATRTVAADQTLWIERMVVPWSISADHRPNRWIRHLFGRMRAAARPSSRAWPRRIYLDRRGSPFRPMLNENELVRALGTFGFEPVRPETLSVADQIALFAEAEFVVAPHGAGLANIVYAHPGCRLVELHVDFWVNWCYRRLAAVCGVAYDCVVGRQLPGVQPDWINHRSWTVPIPQVLDAVERMVAAVPWTAELR